MSSKTIHATLGETDAHTMSASGTIDFEMFSAAVRHVVGTADTAHVGIDEGGMTIEPEEHDRRTFVSARFPADDWETFNAPDAPVVGRFDMNHIYKALTGYDGPDTAELSVEEKGSDVTVNIENHTVSGTASDDYHDEKFEIPMFDPEARLKVGNGYDLKGSFREIDAENMVVALLETNNGRVGVNRGCKEQYRLIADEYRTANVSGIDSELPESPLHIADEKNAWRKDADLYDVKLNRRAIQRRKTGDKDVSLEEPIVWGPSTPAEIQTWAVYKTEAFQNLFSRTLKDHLQDATYRIALKSEYPFMIEREFTEYGTVDGDNSRVAMYTVNVLPDSL